MTAPLDIGSALVVARRTQGMSQRELGDLLGVRQQQVARWEASAYRTADLARVDAAARVLGVFIALTGGAFLATEAPALYGATTTPPDAIAVPSAGGVVPVRDLGEIAARIRANGDEFRDRFHIDRIGVFGSFVYGEQTATSDVDLLVDFSVRPTGFAYFEPQIFCEELLGREVDFVEDQFLRDRLKPRVMKDVVYVWKA